LDEKPKVVSSSNQKEKEDKEDKEDEKGGPPDPSKLIRTFRFVWK
jgi:hypothetical protein